MRLAAVACLSLLVPAPVAAAAPNFGEPITIGSTTRDIGHLAFAGGAAGGRGAVAASAGTTLVTASFGSGGFGPLNELELRLPDNEFGPFLTVDHGGRMLMVEYFRDGCCIRAAALRITPDGRRADATTLTPAGVNGSATLLPNAHGDVLLSVSGRSNQRRLLFARAGEGFHRTPRPPEGIDPDPGFSVTPDRRLVATYRLGGKLQIARGAPGRRWTQPRAVRTGGGYVDLSRLAFAPNGDALLTVLTTERDTTHRVYAAWARRGRGFGRLRLVDQTTAELNVQAASLDRRGRATIVWQSGEHDIHVRRARFGGRFRRAWDTVRAERVFYVEAEPAPAGGAVITWQETPEEFGTNTIRAAFVGAGRTREQLVASTGESRTTFYSPRLHTAAGRVALAWVQNHFAARGGRERAELRGAVLRP